MGVTLFRRLPRAVILTEQAQSVLPLVADAFDKLDLATKQLKENESLGVLTVTTAPIFGAKWLLQHLSDFSEAHPEITVRLDARNEMVDFEREGVDVGVRLGSGNYPGMRVERLFLERVVPVCHPKYLEGENKFRTPSDLNNVTLLHVDWGNILGPLSDWKMWLASAGIENVNATKGPTFTVEVMAISAAVTGSSIALASTYAVEEELESGQLVVPFVHTLLAEAAYWVVTPERKANHLRIKAFREWILKTARETCLAGS